jgi:hypothetical protein
VLAFAVTFTLLLLEIRLRRAQARDAEMRQARFVWMDAGGMGTYGSPGRPDHVDVTVQPVVHNDSDQPIRDVLCTSISPRIVRETSANR